VDPLSPHCSPASAAGAVAASDPRRDWRYLGEGNRSLVVAYAGAHHAQLRGCALRIAKRTAGAGGSDDLARAGSGNSGSYAYAHRVAAPILGAPVAWAPPPGARHDDAPDISCAAAKVSPCIACDSFFVPAVAPVPGLDAAWLAALHGAVSTSRPSVRTAQCRGFVDAVGAHLLMPNLAEPDVGQSDDDAQHVVWCVEIKSKCGFLPRIGSAGPLSSPQAVAAGHLAHHPLRETICPSCLHEPLKCEARGRGDTCLCTWFCPCDLLRAADNNNSDANSDVNSDEINDSPAASATRMVDGALRALAERPSNVMRLFCDGVAVSDTRILATAEHGALRRDVARALLDSGVLPALLRAQAAGDVPPGAVAAFLTSGGGHAAQPSDQGSVTDPSPEVVRAIADRARSINTAALPSCARRQQREQDRIRWSTSEIGGSDRGGGVVPTSWACDAVDAAAFFVSMTCRDASIMCTVAYRHHRDDPSFSSASSPSSPSSPIAMQVAVCDLDRKSPDKIAKWCTQDDDRAAVYAAHSIRTSK
jgi:hypothetical protein